MSLRFACRGASMVLALSLVAADGAPQGKDSQAAPSSGASPSSSTPAGPPADVKVDWGRQRAGEGTPAFEVGELPRPWQDDAAAKATLTVLHGAVDGKSKAERLTDGKLPATDDGPQENFFFGEGVPGGRLLMDLGRVVAVAEVNTFSWHRDARGPQVYVVYGSDGTAAGFKAKPAEGVEPAKAGWTLIARVDTRPGQKPAPDGGGGADARATGATEPPTADATADAETEAAKATAAATAAAAGDDGGGQYVVRIAPAPPEGAARGAGAAAAGSPAPALGRYRYLLFDIRSTGLHPSWDNTFFSEVDVVDADRKPTEPVVTGPTTRGDNPDPNGL